MEGEERRIAAESCPQCGGPVPFSHGTRLTCRYCGASLVRLAGPGREEGAEGASAHGADETWAVRLKRVVCMDPKFGVGVFHWMIPADWEFEGTVWWRDSVTMPAVIPFRAWNPEGPEQIECFPSLPHVWGENPVTKAMGKWAPKQYYFKQDGVDTYMDTGGQQVELPTGYDQVWSNGQGEYIVTDNTLFDPNADQTFNTQNWQTLERRA